MEDRSQNSKLKQKLKKKLKKCLSNKSKKNMQEVNDSIKRPNIRIMGIEEGEEVQAKVIHNIFNKIMTENFPNLQKVLPIQVQEAPRTPNRLDQNRTSLWHIIIKTTSTENRERKLKAVRRKNK
jgi:hypothetical protein